MTRSILRLLAAGLLFLVRWNAEAQGLRLGLGDNSSTKGPPKVKDSEATLVVYNATDPASKELAAFYATRRMIPRDQVIGLRCSNQEEISRAEYDSTIAEPLRRAFTSNFWWKLRDADNPLGPVESNRIRFVALIRGIPLKISGTTNYPGDKPTGPPPISSHNEASVDSELSMLAVPHIISGAMGNPYFRSFSPFADIDRPELLLVCRLDAPNAVTVKRMITDSIATEKKALQGFAYVDARGLDAGQVGLKEGDDWLMSAAAAIRRKGIPVILDVGPGMFPDGYPMRHAAIYLGWYTDNVNATFLQRGFHFEPGAVACHIHSYSAVTLRDSRKGWAGPLLELGAAATLGNVYEPYLALTPRLDTFAERLMAGFTFAESAYMAQRALSWMTTFIGDPLYRPFPLGDLSADRNSKNEWQAYAAGAKIWYGASVAEGERSLKESAARLHSGVIYEGLGLLELGEHRNDAALSAFQEARRAYTSADDLQRAAIHEVILLQSMDRKGEALKLARAQVSENPASPAVSVFQMLCPELAPKPPAPPPAAPGKP